MIARALVCALAAILAVSGAAGASGRAKVEDAKIAPWVVNRLASVGQDSFLVLFASADESDPPAAAPASAATAHQRGRAVYDRLRGS